MAPNFDMNLIDEIINNAPTAGYGPQVTFGKCVMTIKAVSWKDKKPIEREYDGKPIKDGEYLQFHFEIDLKEFNSALDFSWHRKVDVKKSNKTAAKPTLTDWSEIVEPSVVAVFGKDWVKKLTKGVYVEVDDIPTVHDKKSYVNKDGKEVFYSAPRFVRAFKSAADCNAAREERFTKRGDSDSEAVEGEVIPAKVVSDVKGLINSLGEDQARTILEGDPFNMGESFTVDDLIAAANAS